MSDWGAAAATGRLGGIVCDVAIASGVSARRRGAAELLRCRPRGAGDLVVFHPPASFYVSKGDTPPTSERGEVTLVKRVVALGGDVIEVAQSTPPHHMLTRAGRDADA